jgi:Na+-transporting methylmalonyl-CoA/oxaloacetate decarboxylase gamma subunit
MGMKAVKWIVSVVISLLIVGAVYVWSVFYNWGVPYFEYNFSFSGMVLPFIFLFGLVLLIVRPCTGAVANKIAYSRMTDDEKREHDEKKAQAINERQQRFKEYAETQAKIRESNISSQPIDNTPRCPKCGSTSVSGDKKGFGVGKAVVGAALAGPIGLAAGGIGAKKVRVTCLNCGHHWMAGKH